MANPWKMSNWFSGVKKFHGTYDKNADRMFRAIAKGKKVEVTNPTSKRSFFRGADTTFVGGDYEIGEIVTADAVVEMSSTAISKAEYDPTTNTAYITFHGGTKPYEYEVSPAEFEEFINAPSKGQWVASYWNNNAHFRKAGF